MKRSKTITLTLLTGTSLAVTGCDDGPSDPRYFTDKAACIQELGDASLCDTAERQAMAQHTANAPHYQSMAECEAQHGQGKCVQPPTGGSANTVSGVSSGGSFFMPLMAGYMMGRMTGGSWFGSPRYAAQPVCNQGGLAYAGGCGTSRSGGYSGFRAGTFSRGSFQPAPDVSNSWRSSPAVKQAPQIGSPNVRRGGFGTRASRSYGG